MHVIVIMSKKKEFCAKIVQKTAIPYPSISMMHNIGKRLSCCPESLLPMLVTFLFVSHIELRMTFDDFSCACNFIQKIVKRKHSMLTNYVR